MRARSSVKWTALTGVTPGTIGSSVNGAVTCTRNDCAARRPSGSVAVTFDRRQAFAHRRQRQAGARHPHRHHMQRRRGRSIGQRIAIRIPER